MPAAVAQVLGALWRGALVRLCVRFTV
jgi:hypothetical protein